jgi:hypothetical protein
MVEGTRRQALGLLVAAAASGRPSPSPRPLRSPAQRPGTTLNF